MLYDSTENDEVVLVIESLNVPKRSLQSAVTLLPLVNLRVINGDKIVVPFYKAEHAKETAATIERDEEISCFVMMMKWDHFVSLPKYRR